MIIKQQANYAKAAVLPVQSVSEFTHSFSFTPSSELYEWTNVGNSKLGYRGQFQIQPGSPGDLHYSVFSQHVINPEVGHIGGKECKQCH